MIETGTPFEEIVIRSIEPNKYKQAFMSNLIQPQKIWTVGALTDCKRVSSDHRLTSKAFLEFFTLTGVSSKRPEVISL